MKTSHSADVARSGESVFLDLTYVTRFMDELLRNPVTAQVFLDVPGYGRAGYRPRVSRSVSYASRPPPGFDGRGRMNDRRDCDDENLLV